jgi:hypothetical protein
MQTFVKNLQNLGYRVCGVYLLDSTFIVDPSKFMSGSLMALSAMVRLELPHVNVLTKMDLVAKRGQNPEDMEKFLNPDILSLMHDINEDTAPRFHKLNEAIGSLLDDYSMVSFIPLDITDEESIEALLLQIDNAIQYGEDTEVKEPRDEDEELDEYVDEGAYLGRDDDDDDFQ